MSCPSPRRGSGCLCPTPRGDTGASRHATTVAVRSAPDRRQEALLLPQLPVRVSSPCRQYSPRITVNQMKASTWERGRRSHGPPISVTARAIHSQLSVAIKIHNESSWFTTKYRRVSAPLQQIFAAHPIWCHRPNTHACWRTTQFAKKHLNASRQPRPPHPLGPVGSGRSGAVRRGPPQHCSRPAPRRARTDAPPETGAPPTLLLQSSQPSPSRSAAGILGRR
jgi:hypothetical protein